MKRIVIKVPAVNADILEIGEDCANLGQPNYIIEKIGEPSQMKRARRWLR